MEVQHGRGPDLLVENRVMAAWRTSFETAQRLRTVLDRQLKEATGSDLVDLNLLMTLAEAEGRRLTMSVLAERLVFSVPRLSYRIRAHTDRGWVEKVPCVADARAHEIVLTDAGLERFGELGALHREHVRAVFDRALPLEQMEQLAAAMEAIGSRL